MTLILSSLGRRGQALPILPSSTAPFLTKTRKMLSFVFKQLPERGVYLAERQFHNATPASCHGAISQLVPFLVIAAIAFAVFKLGSALLQPKSVSTPPKDASDGERTRQKEKEVARVEREKTTESNPSESSSKETSRQQETQRQQEIELQPLEKPSEGVGETAADIPAGERPVEKEHLEDEEWHVINRETEEASPPSKGVLAGVVSVVGSVMNPFMEHGDPKKVEKYKLALEQYQKTLPVGAREDINGLAKAHPTNQMYRHLAAALNTLLGQGQDPRVQYQTYVQKLRAVIASPEYQTIRYKNYKELNVQEKQCRDIVRSLVYVRWFGVEVFDYLEEMTEHFIIDYNQHRSDVSTQRAPLTLENFGPTLLDLNGRVGKASPKVTKPKHALVKQKLSGEIGAEDFTGDKNLPHRLARHVYTSTTSGERREVHYHRHGSPTVGGHPAQALASFFSSKVTKYLGTPTFGTGETVAIDYEEAILAAKEKGENILYCNHQRRLEGDTEYTRATVLEGLQGQEKHLENHHVFTQSVESPLFKGTGPITFAQLQKELTDSFYGKNAPCSLPLRLQSDQHYKGTVLPGLIRQVKEIFFAGKDRLETQEERQSFILLFYVFQKIDLKLRLNITHYKTPCKDFLDRGGMMAMLENIVHLVMSKETVSSEDLDGVLYNALGAAILVKKIGVIEERFRPGLAVVKRLSELPGPQQGQLKALRFMEDWQVTDALIGKRLQQATEQLLMFF
ncbi:MAG: hypothetical protein HYZ47_02585 [Simkania negevensis]|nr:hypothetical protein [Simkania negevensis]